MITRRPYEGSATGTFHAVARFVSINFKFETAVKHMPESRSSTSSTSDFNRAFGDAKKNAAGVAGEISDAAKDLYDHASDSASQVADATSRAARKTGASFEKALRDTIENQPYTAVAIAIGLGWLLGRMHRPL
jgi:ElaB/YqjD/DUF883 family membrane-anchored ribosome-binding protein